MPTGEMSAEKKPAARRDFSDRQRLGLSLASLALLIAILAALCIDGRKKDRSYEAWSWRTGEPSSEEIPSELRFPMPAVYKLLSCYRQTPFDSFFCSFVFLKEDSDAWFDSFDRFLADAGATVQSDESRRLWLKTRLMAGEVGEYRWSANVETSWFQQTARAEVSRERRTR